MCFPETSTWLIFVFLKHFLSFLMWPDILIDRWALLTTSPLVYFTPCLCVISLPSATHSCHLPPATWRHLLISALAPKPVFTTPNKGLLHVLAASACFSFFLHFCRGGVVVWLSRTDSEAWRGDREASRSGWMLGRNHGIGVGKNDQWVRELDK